MSTYGLSLAMLTPEDFTSFTSGLRHLVFSVILSKLRIAQLTAKEPLSLRIDYFSLTSADNFTTIRAMANDDRVINLASVYLLPAHRLIIGWY